MARYKSLRNRTVKTAIQDLRERVVEAYSHQYIARRRMMLLLGILDLFEREAFLPYKYTASEYGKEQEFEEALTTKTPSDTIVTGRRLKAKKKKEANEVVAQSTKRAVPKRKR